MLWSGSLSTWSQTWFVSKEKPRWRMWPGGPSEDLRALLVSWPTLSPWVSVGSIAEWDGGGAAPSGS